MSIDMFTLYRQDRDHVSHDLPERLRLSLDLPAKVACSMCVRYPKLWPYVMDFIQEANIKLIEAHEKCDPAWNMARFQSYVAKSCRGAILQYLSRTFDIYIPPTMRHRMLKEREEGATVAWLEHHVSWDKLLEHMAIIPDKNTQQAFSDTARTRIDTLLAQLPDKEQQALTLYYGIDTYAHTSQEIGDLFHVHADHAKHLVNTAIQRLQGEQVKLPRSEWITAIRASYTECSQGHPANAENTYIDKKGKRSCRICHSARARETYQRKKSKEVVA